MTDYVAAHAAISGRAREVIPDLPLLWPDEDHVLPDEPAPFVFFEIMTESANQIEFGGDRGQHRHRNSALLHAYVMVPRGRGILNALELAEPVATGFRSFKAAGVEFYGADVHPVGEGEDLNPPGLRSVAGNYACCIVEAPFTFDQPG